MAIGGSIGSIGTATFNIALSIGSIPRQIGTATQSITQSINRSIAGINQRVQAITQSQTFQVIRSLQAVTNFIQVSQIAFAYAFVKEIPKMIKVTVKVMAGLGKGVAQVAVLAVKGGAIAVKSVAHVVKGLSGLLKVGSFVVKSVSNFIKIGAGIGRIFVPSIARIGAAFAKLGAGISAKGISLFAKSGASALKVVTKSAADVGKALAKLGGEGATTALKSLSGTLTQLSQKFASGLPAIAKQAGAALNSVKQTVMGLGSSFQNVIGNLGKIAQSPTTALAPLVQANKTLRAALNDMAYSAGKSLSDMLAFFTNTFSKVKDSIQSLFKTVSGIPKIFSGIKFPDIGQKFINVIEKIKSTFNLDFLNKVIKGVQSKVGALFNDLSKLGGSFKKDLSSASTLISKGLTGLKERFGEVIKLASGIPQVITKGFSAIKGISFAPLKAGATEVFKLLGGGFQNVGKGINAIGGVIGGVVKQWGFAMAFLGAATPAIRTLGKALFAPSMSPLESWILYLMRGLDAASSSATKIFTAPTKLASTGKFIYLNEAGVIDSFTSTFSKATAKAQTIINRFKESGIKGLKEEFTRLGKEIKDSLSGISQRAAKAGEAVSNTAKKAREATANAAKKVGSDIKKINEMIENDTFDAALDKAIDEAFDPSKRTPRTKPQRRSAASVPTQATAQSVSQATAQSVSQATAQSVSSATKQGIESGVKAAQQSIQKGISTPSSKGAAEGMESGVKAGSSVAMKRFKEMKFGQAAADAFNKEFPSKIAPGVVAAQKNFEKMWAAGFRKSANQFDIKLLGDEWNKKLNEGFAGRVRKSVSAPVQDVADYIPQVQGLNEYLNSTKRTAYALRESAIAFLSLKESAVSFRLAITNVTAVYRQLKTEMTAAISAGMSATAGLGAGGVTQMNMFDRQQGLRLSIELQTVTNQIKALAVASGDSKSMVAEVVNEINRLGATTAKTPQEIALTAVSLIRLGFSAQQVKETLDGVVKTSIATGLEMNVVAETMAAALNQFGLDASESGRIGDLFASVTANSAANVVDIGEGLKYVGASAKAANQNIEDTVAVLGMLRSAGMEGGMSGTGMMAALRSLQMAGASSFGAGDMIGASGESTIGDSAAGGKQRANALEQLGLSSRDILTAEGKTKSILDIIPRLKEQVEELKQTAEGQASVPVILDTLFGESGGRTISALLGMTNEQMNKIISSARNYRGFAAEAAEIMNEGVVGKLREMQSKITAIALTVGDTFKPIMALFIGGVNRAIGMFALLPKPMQSVSLLFATTVPLITAYYRGLNLLIYASDALVIAKKAVTFAMQENALALTILKVKQITLAVVEMANVVRNQISIRVMRMMTLTYTKQIFAADLLFIKEKALALITGALSAAYGTTIQTMRKMANQFLIAAQYAGTFYMAWIAVQALLEKSQGAKNASIIDGLTEQAGKIQSINPDNGIDSVGEKIANGIVKGVGQAMQVVKHQVTQGISDIMGVVDNIKIHGIVEGIRQSIVNSVLVGKVLIISAVTAIAATIFMAMFKTKRTVTVSLKQYESAFDNTLKSIGQKLNIFKTAKDFAMSIKGESIGKAALLAGGVAGAGGAIAAIVTLISPELALKIGSIIAGIGGIVTAFVQFRAFLETGAIQESLKNVRDGFVAFYDYIAKGGLVASLQSAKDGLLAFQAYLASGGILKSLKAFQVASIAALAKVKAAAFATSVTLTATIGMVLGIGVLIAGLAMLALSLRADPVSKYGKAWGFATAEQRGAAKEMIALEKLSSKLNAGIQERQTLLLNYKSYDKDTFAGKAEAAIAQAQQEIDLLKQVETKDADHQKMINNEISIRENHISLLRARNYELQRGVKAEETMRFTLEQINDLIAEQTFEIEKNAKRREMVIAQSVSQGLISKESGQTQSLQNQLRAEKNRLKMEEAALRSIEESKFGETDVEELDKLEEESKKKQLALYDMRAEISKKEMELREAHVAELSAKYKEEREVTSDHHTQIQNQLVESLEKQELHYKDYNLKNAELSKMAMEAELASYQKQLEDLAKLKEQGKISDIEYNSGSKEINNQIVETERQIQEARLNEIRIAYETEGSLREQFKEMAIQANEDQFREQNISLEEYNNRVRAINQINLQERQKEITMELNMLIKSFQAGELAATQYIQRREELESAAREISGEIEQQRLDDLKAYHEQALTEVENFKDKAILANEEQYRQGLISREDYKSRSLEIDTIMSYEVLENRKKELEALESSYKAGEIATEGYIERRKELSNSIKEAEDQLNKARMASIRDYYTKAIKEVERFTENERLEVKRQLAAGEIDRREYNEALKQIDQSGSEERKRWLEAELKALEDNNKKGIISVEDFGDRKEEILEELGDIAEAQLDREIEKLEEVARAYEDKLSIMAEQMSLQESLNELEIVEAQAAGASDVRIEQMRLEQVKQITELKRQELEAQLAKNLATAEDVELQRQLNELALQQFEVNATKDIKGAEMGLRNAFDSADSAGQERESERYELKGAYLDDDINKLEQINNLREEETQHIEQSRQALEQRAAIAQSNSQIVLQGLEQQVALADELLNLLNAGAEADKIRAEIASQIGLPAQATELEILKKKYELQTQADEEKQRMMDMQHQLQDQILQSENQQNAIAAERAVQEAFINNLKSQQAVISAEAAMAEARATGASADKIAVLKIGLDIAKRQLDLSARQVASAQQNVEAVKDQNAARQTALDLQQTIESSEQKATAEAADRTGRLAIATAEAKENSEGMADAMGKVADNAGKAADEMGEAADEMGKAADAAKSTSTQKMAYQRPDLEEISKKELELAAKIAEAQGDTDKARQIRDQIASEQRTRELEDLQKEARYLQEQRALYYSERERFIKEQTTMAQSLARVMPGFSVGDANEKVSRIVENVYGKEGLMGVTPGGGKSAQLLNEALQGFNPSALQQGNKEMQKSMEKGNQDVVQGLDKVNDTLAKGAARPNNITINGSQDTGGDLEKTLGALQRAQR